MTIQLLDRIPRFASLLGLLGLVGVAGVFDSELYRFSALSFLSYLCFFRFFHRFIDPHYGPTAAFTPLLLLAVLAAPVSLWLFSISPLFGFLGFAGCLGLYDPSPNNAPFTNATKNL
jgi:hypothetical protein